MRSTSSGDLPGTSGHLHLYIGHVGKRIHGKAAGGIHSKSEGDRRQYNNHQTLPEDAVDQGMHR